MSGEKKLPKAICSVTMDRDMKAQVDEVAGDQHRSFSAQVCYYVAQGLKRDAILIAGEDIAGAPF
tara:strand:- start:2740 stop:2934 length:195 start_codon:yes stop_codon:yes gene_type:complete